MNSRRASLAAAAGIGLVELVLAFLVAPQSCDGGLTLYFWAGVAALVVLLALPFVLLRELVPVRRVGWGLGLGVAGLMVWVAGLFLADVRIFCRLF